MREGLAPRVEERGDADGAAEVTRIASEGEQGVRGGAEEERVDHARIALRQGIERVRESEDDVEVGNGQQVGLAGRQPPLRGQRLALGVGTTANDRGSGPLSRALWTEDHVIGAAERNGLPFRFDKLLEPAPLRGFKRLNVLRDRCECVEPLPLRRRPRPRR